MIKRQVPAQRKINAKVSKDLIFINHYPLKRIEKDFTMTGDFIINAAEIVNDIKRKGSERGIGGQKKTVKNADYGIGD
jgi:hypothetical protein